MITDATGKTLSLGKVSILILTHNAPRYVWLTLKSLRMTTGVDYEVICVDNNSKWLTRCILVLCHKWGWIDKLCLLNYNSLFAGGNNIAARLAAKDSKYFLLLNSDVQVMRPDWLGKLLAEHKPGASSYGVVPGIPSVPIPRLDGFCFLVDRDLYDKFGLDESRFQWNWAVTYLQANLLACGKVVRGFAEHGEFLLHFGGKSGAGFSGAKGLDTQVKEVHSWFTNGFPILEERIKD